jgi:hypothetical protein
VAVEPPLDEIRVASLTIPGGHKPHLVISLDCLGQILAHENSVIAEEDVLLLMAAICRYAERAGQGNPDLARQLAEHYDQLYEQEYQDGD